MKKYQLATLVWLLAPLAQGQDQVDMRTQTKNVDFSGAAYTIPAKSGATLPAVCNQGEFFFNTANNPGQNLYTCSPANTWTQLATSTSGTVSSAAAGQFAYYAANGNVVVGHALTAADIPSLSYQAPLTFTGSGAKTASSTGTATANDCAKWDANGNVVDAGAPCGAGSGGGSTLSTPAATTAGNIPQYGNATGSALTAGLGLVTTVGSPGANTNVPTEQAVRSAINAAVTASGALPAQTGSAGYLITNGTAATWGDLTTGPTGALCAGTGCSGGTPGIIDIVTSVVPLLAGANTFTGVNKFQQLQVSIYTVATLPTCNSSFEGQTEGVSDAASPSYLAAVTGGGSVHAPVYCNGTSWVAH